MALSAPDSDNHQPTGNLEHLFRAKLAEAEVTPRIQLWEQLDHELLVQQNDSYRRRLLVHRWVAAACLLLALSAGSWLTWRTAGGFSSTPIELAKQSAGREGRAANLANTQAARGSGSKASGLAAGTPAESALGPGFGTPYVSAAGATQQGLGNGAVELVTRTPQAYASAQTQAAPGRDAVSGFRTNSGLRAEREATSRLEEAAQGLASLSFRPVAATHESGFGRPDTLKPALPAGPALLAQQTPWYEQEIPTSTSRAKRWRLGGGYAATAFNPNADFGSAATVASFSPGVGAGPTAASTRRVPADEYHNLQAGLGQRLAFTAERVLTRRWTLATGLEASEQRASSTSSYGVLEGKQARAYADLMAYSPGPPADPRTTNYRYRLATVPVSVRYGASRTGWSLYAKVGAAVSVLLSSRSELKDVPSATQFHGLASADSPYRKVLGSVRGGAGMRYQPADASWSLALGPTTEAGLTSITAQPRESFFQQARPYAVGVEASVGFGSTKAAAVAP